jgi:DNA repair exonuclease SbcCD ATPase subunit
MKKLLTYTLICTSSFSCTLMASGLTDQEIDAKANAHIQKLEQEKKFEPLTPITKKLEQDLERNRFVREKKTERIQRNLEADLTAAQEEAKTTTVILAQSEQQRKIQEETMIKLEAERKAILKTKDETQRKLQAQLTAAQEETKATTVKLTQSEQQIKILGDELKKHESERVELLKMKDEQSVQNQRLQTSCTELEAKKKEIEGKLEAAQKGRAKNIETLKKELAQVDKDYLEAIEKLRAEKVKTAKLESNLKVTETKVAELTKLYKDLHLSATGTEVDSPFKESNEAKGTVSVRGHNTSKPPQQQLSTTKPTKKDNEDEDDDEDEDEDMLTLHPKGKKK